MLGVRDMDAMNFNKINRGPETMAARHERSQHRLAEPLLATRPLGKPLPIMPNFGA